MSAYMCHEDHLMHLAFAMCDHDRHGSAAAHYHRGEIAQAGGIRWDDASDRDRVGAVYGILESTNAESILARYPKHGREMIEGSHGMTVAMYERVKQARRQHPPSVVQLIKSVHCYEYQACEFDAWKDSTAYKLCEGLIDTLIHRLPGYDSAQWGAPCEREKMPHELARS